MQLSIEQTQKLMARHPEITGEMIPKGGLKVEDGGKTYYVFMDMEGVVHAYDDPPEITEGYAESGFPMIKTLIVVAVGAWLINRMLR